MRVPNIHFDPESRQLQTARLEHLLSFSDLLLLLIAEPGLGRTHLLSHLRPEQSPVQPYWVQITPDSAFDVTQLLQALVAQLGLSCEPANRARLTALHAYARALEQVEQQLIICIDDADFLSDNALELLINFSKVDTAAPKVLLSGLPAFEQRFYEREFNRLVEGTLHIEHLQPYTVEEARAFVDAHLIDGRVLKDAEYRRLLNESQGRPDQLKSALARLLEHGVASKNSGVGVGNRWYWAGIALVLSSVAVALGYLYFPGSSPDENIRRPVEIAVPQITPALTDQEPQLVEARSELAKRLAEQEARLAQVAEAPETPEANASGVNTAAVTAQDENLVVKPEPDPIPQEVKTIETAEVAAAEPAAIDEPATAVTGPDLGSTGNKATAVAEVAVQLPPGAELTEDVEPAISAPSNSREVDATPPAAKPAAPILKTDSSADPKSSAEPKFSAAIEQVLAWPASHLTVQLLAAREERTADQLLAKHSAVDGLLKLSYPYQGAPRYTLVYGHFATRADAQRAVEKLPASLRQLKPWIRSVEGLKTELNQGLNP